MKPFEERYTAWVDGELTGRDLIEFEAELARRGGAPEEKVSLLRLGDFLRSHATAARMGNGDFFNRQILDRLEKEQAIQAAPARPIAFRFPMGRLAWAGAFCLVIAAVIFFFAIPLGPQENRTSSAYMAQVLDTHSTDPAISAPALHWKKENVTVVWMDGLEYVPAEYAEK